MAESDPHPIEGVRDPPAPDFARRWQAPADARFAARLADRLDLLRLGIGAWLEREIEAGRGFLWLPVAFGVGSLLYFALPSEPSAVALSLLALVLWGMAWAGRRRAGLVRLVLLLAMVATGATASKLRTDALATRVLERQVTGTVTGWVEARKARRGGYRLTILVAGLDARRITTIPQRVTVTVRGRDVPKVGEGISALARLRPASGPVLPGGYDFARDSFYRGVGATGFAYGKVKRVDLGPAPLSIRLRAPLEDIREAIRARIDASLTGESRYVATALIIGDAGGLSEKTEDELRLSGLAHILSVSGLHMALVSGAIYWTVRAGLALVPALALRRPIKKWAAIAALLLSGFYLLISGLDVAAQRSFVMTSIAFLAILADRRAISMRNVALAGLVVLAVTPESILSASFQMSFAATVALVAGFELMAERHRRRLATNASLPRGRAALLSRRLLLFGGGMVVTSLLGGLGTTPFALYHFQRMAPLSILANVAAMPLTDFLVMPAALIAVLLMPFGLEAPPLAIVGWGIDGMLVVAAKVSEWSGQSGGAAMPSATALLIFIAGFAWLALWRERWRLAGLAPMVLGAALALYPARPGLLVSADGRQIALRGEDGRYSIVARKQDRFVTDIWLRSDGDPRDAALPGVVQAGGCDASGCVGRLPDGGLVALALDRSAFEEDCRRAVLIVSPLAVPASCGLHTAVLDRHALNRAGSIALIQREGILSGPVEGLGNSAAPEDPAKAIAPNGLTAPDEAIASNAPIAPADGFLPADPRSSNTAAVSATAEAVILDTGTARPPARDDETESRAADAADVGDLAAAEASGTDAGAAAGALPPDRQRSVIALGRGDPEALASVVEGASRPGAAEPVPVLSAPAQTELSDVPEADPPERYARERLARERNAEARDAEQRYADQGDAKENALQDREVERSADDEDVLPPTVVEAPSQSELRPVQLADRFEVLTAYAPVRRPWMPRYEPGPDDQ
ncbi:hypothetical protein K32_22840 [Kaistia sp. 32K]|uniref:ComEC/Rec2 family competence protein n=1 Tax=Kaistia sp. 32K TaxID=2795690 RepID=UPI0019169477|nr:ComEC/Rec2 family competence protein [Kaistia sp. 32K]BCP53667.1 hypothetical protein K32_22840 [Kaistia sp. 32K]